MAESRFQKQAPAQETKKRWTGGGGGSKQEFDPRPTPKEFMMARMSAGQVGAAMATVEQNAGLLPEGTTFYSRTKELIQILYDEIVAAGNDSPRADWKPGQGGSSSSPSGAAAAVAKQIPVKGQIEVDNTVMGFPHADLVPPLGKYSDAKMGEGNGLTLKEIASLPAGRSEGPCWLVWFSSTDQKQQKNIDFKNEVVEFLQAMESAGRLPEDSTCEGNN